MMDRQESFSGKNKYIEKVHYIGDLRIVGQVVNKISDENPIGYVIMVEKTRQFKMYTVEQTVQLLKKFKFVNAELTCNKVENTECSMKRMPKFNTNMQVIDNFGVIVLGEIIVDGKKLGYRVMDTQARIVDLSENDMIALSDKNTQIINAKVTNNTSQKRYISAIKGEFTKIEKSKVPEINSDAFDKSKASLREEQHVRKLIDKITVAAMHWLLCDDSEILVVGTVNSSRLMKDGETVGTYFDLAKETNIILKEVLTEANGVVLSDKDKQILKNIKKRNKVIKSDCLNCEYTLENDEDKLYIASLLQFMLNNKEFGSSKIFHSKWCQDLIHKGKKLEFKRVNELKKQGLLSDSLAGMKYHIHLGTTMFKEKAPGGEEYEKKLKEKMFSTTDFRSGENCAQLGFAINNAMRNHKYTTLTGCHKTLLYIGDAFDKYLNYEPHNELYTEIKKRARCLGDMLSVIYILKLLDIETSDDRKKNTYLNEKFRRASIEMIVSIAYLYNSESMHYFVENYLLDKLDKYVIDIELPNFDDVSQTDYKLSDELKLYYTSGFNVFLSDAEYYNYKKEYLMKSTYINYRQLGNSHDIKHELIQGELGSIVNMITGSQYCDAETVEYMIGHLRFL